MQSSFSTPYTFTAGSILANAPATSGIYGISNSREWLLIGEADNIRQRLIEHAGESGTDLASQNPTGFSFEACTAPARAARLRQLVVQFNPVSHRRTSQHRSRG